MKKGLRVLAIAESFRQNHPKSIFAGVVTRRDCSIGDFIFKSVTLEENNDAKTVLDMGI